MIFLKSQDCVFQVEILRHVSARWEFGEVGQVTPLPPPNPPLEWVQGMVLQDCQAEIPAKKLKRGHRKKNFWPNFGWFYQKQAEKGPQKIFKRSSLFLAVITVINLIFNIQYTNFLRPLFCLFLVKSAKIRPEIFFCGPFWAFWPEFLPGNLATPFPELHVYWTEKRIIVAEGAIFQGALFSRDLFLMHKCLNRDHHSCDKPLKAKVFFILYPSRAV